MFSYWALWSLEVGFEFILNTSKTQKECKDFSWTGTLQEKTIPFQHSFNKILLILYVDLEVLIRTNFNTNLLIEALVKCPTYTSKKI